MFSQTVPGRGRGRPPKNAPVVKAKSDEEAEEEEWGEMKRTGGRKRKYKVIRNMNLTSRVSLYFFICIG